MARDGFDEVRLCRYRMDTKVVLDQNYPVIVNDWTDTTLELFPVTAVAATNELFNVLTSIRIMSLA